VTSGRWVLFALAGALAAGCAPPLQQQAVEVELTPACCSSPREFEFVPIAIGQEVRLEVGADAPVFDFGDGKSRFRGVSMASGERRWLAIKSRFTLATVGNQYFHPVVTFYDVGFARISEMESRLTVRSDSVFGELYEGGDVQVPEGAVYAVFWTSQSVLAHWTRPVPSLAERMIVTEPIYTPALTGRLDVRLKQLF
jgi:hypothetical protein